MSDVIEKIYIFSGLVDSDLLYEIAYIMPPYICFKSMYSLMMSLENIYSSKGIIIYFKCLV